MASETVGRGLMAKITYGQQVIPAATATKVPLTPLNQRQSIIVINLDSASMYVGGDSSVTNANGFTLTTNATVALEVSDSAPVYVYSVLGGTVNYLEARS